MPFLDFLRILFLDVCLYTRVGYRFGTTQHEHAFPQDSTYLGIRQKCARKYSATAQEYRTGGFAEGGSGVYCRFLLQSCEIFEDSNPAFYGDERNVRQHI